MRGRVVVCGNCGTNRCVCEREAQIVILSKFKESDSLHGGTILKFLPVLIELTSTNILGINLSLEYAALFSLNVIMSLDPDA